MDSIVIELQQEALDHKIPLSSLLRKALVVSKKLGIKEFEVWATDELNGYGNKDAPDYRIANVQLKALNPHHGWRPILFDNPSLAETLSRLGILQSVASLESLVSVPSANHPQMAVPGDVEQILWEALGYQTEITIAVPPTEIISILDTVRTIILKWALKLQEDGILGEGLSFTQKEKVTASANSYHVNHFHAAVGSAQIQQNSNQSSQTIVNSSLTSQNINDFVSDVKNVLANLHLKKDEEDELKAEIQTLEAQIASPKPKQSTIKESLSAAKRILETTLGGAGGTIAAQLISKYFFGP